MSCGSAIVTAPVSAGSVSTRMASGSENRICSGRVIRSKNRETTRKQSVTLMSMDTGCSMSWRTCPWYRDA